MARKKRIAAIALLISTTTLVTVVLGSVYVAMGRVRPFYAEALQLDPQKLETGSRELESRATALYSEARQPGQWQAAFTADQINGWLALQLAEVYADALPDEISEPRVAIEDDHLTLGFRTRRGGVDTVVSADATVMLTDEGDVAIRLLSVQAGALPLPVMQVADDVSRGMSETVAAGPLDASRRPARGDCRRGPRRKRQESARGSGCGRAARWSDLSRRPYDRRRTRCRGYEPVKMSCHSSASERLLQLDVAADDLPLEGVTSADSSRS